MNGLVVHNRGTVNIVASIFWRILKSTFPFATWSSRGYVAAWLCGARCGGGLLGTVVTVIGWSVGPDANMTQSSRLMIFQWYSERETGGRPCDREVHAGNSFKTSFHITAYVGSDSYVYFRGTGPAIGGFYPGCTASGHRGQYSHCCRYEYAFVATPAPVVEQPEMQAKDSDTSAVGVTRVTSVVQTVILVSLTHAAVEDSSFSMSPLSPGLFFRPPRRSTSRPAGGVLLPTTLDDFDDSVLGDPITYAQCEQFPGSESSFSLPVCVAVRFGRSAGPSSTSDCVGFGDLRSANGGSHGLGRGRVIRDRTTVKPRTDSRSPAVCCLQMETRHMVSSFIIFVFWSSWKLRSWPGSSLVVPFMYEL